MPYFVEDLKQLVVLENDRWASTNTVIAALKNLQNVCACCDNIQECVKAVVEDLHSQGKPVSICKRMEEGFWIDVDDEKWAPLLRKMLASKGLGDLYEVIEQCESSIQEQYWMRHTFEKAGLFTWRDIGIYPPNEHALIQNIVKDLSVNDRSTQNRMQEQERLFMEARLVRMPRASDIARGKRKWLSLTP
eukprot:Filipodium_phascolosomae@DN1528_c0_g1_i1.p1